MPQTKNWYLRKNDGTEYGPVSLADLQRWSAQCRLVAGNAVSTDREEWLPVETLPELEMNWVAHRPDGKEYGPFALTAAPELFSHGVLPADAVLINRHTGERQALVDVLPANLTSETEASDRTASSAPGADSARGTANAADSGERQASGADAPDTLPETEARGGVRRTSESARGVKLRRTSRGGRRQDNQSQPELLQPAGRPERAPESAPEASTAEVPEEDDIAPDETEMSAAGPERDGLLDSSSAELPGDVVASSEDDAHAAPVPGEDRSAAAGDAAMENTEQVVALQAALDECRRQRDADVAALRMEIDELQRQIDVRQARLDELDLAGAARIAEQEQETGELQAEIERLMQVLRESDAQIKAMETERRERQSPLADDVADLRKQTAFMKKNMAVLNAELELVRGRRGSGASF
jgi:hypothetical protein